MGSTASRIAGLCALGIGALLWFGTSQANEVRRGAAVFAPAQGQEVVVGSYSCGGTVFTDDQTPRIDAVASLNATSGITSGFFVNSRGSSRAPADLDAMAEICETHLSSVVAQVPSICTLGAIERGRGGFGNGENTFASFAFSCQGARDEVIGVIGGFSSLLLTAPLP